MRTIYIYIWYTQRTQKQKCSSGYIADIEISTPHALITQTYNTDTQHTDTDKTDAPGQSLSQSVTHSLTHRTVVAISTMSTFRHSPMSCTLAPPPPSICLSYFRQRR
jgi:hypothetical protein